MSGTVMAQRRSLRANFSWNLLANIVYGVYQWGMVAVVAKFLGASMVGALSLALAVAVPVQMFLNLQLRAIQASDATAQYKFGQYFQVRLLSVAVFVAAMIPVALWGPLSSTAAAALVAVIPLKAVESISDVLAGLFQQHERMDISSRARIAEATGALMVLTAIVWQTGRLIPGLLGIAVWLIIVQITYTVPRMRMFSGWSPTDLWPPDWTIVRQIVLLALPLGVTMGLVNLNASLPRLVLGHSHSDFEVGIYAGLTQLVFAGVILVGAMGQAVLPTLARGASLKEWDSIERLVVRLALSGAGVGVLGAAFSAVIGGQILEILYSTEYKPFQSELTLLAVGAGFSFAATFIGVALTALRILHQQVTMLLGVLVTVAFSCALLVPAHGLMGAIVSVSAGYLFQLIASYWLLKRFLHSRREAE